MKVLSFIEPTKDVDIENEDEIKIDESRVPNLLKTHLVNEVFSKFFSTHNEEPTPDHKPNEFAGFSGSFSL